MKKYTVLGASSFVLILLFQNCGKPPVSTDQNSQVGVVAPANQQYNKYSVDGLTNISLWDYLKYRYLDLDVSTGVMTAYEEAGQVTGQTFQLSSDKLSELKTILSGSEICEPIVNPQDLEGRVCTMAYRYPYAILSDKASEVRLGERTDGCDIPVDLCGDKAAQLLTWTKSVVESL